MGARGPAPKDPAHRQRKNDSNLVVLPSNQLSRLPEAPKGLSKATADEWTAYVNSPVAAAVDAQSDLANLELLFRLKDKIRRYEEAAKGKELVEGSKGQLILNPLLKEAHSLLAEVRQMGDRFGMSPQSRARLGIVIGEYNKTLEEMNATLAANPDEAEEEDPRTKAQSR